MGGDLRIGALLALSGCMGPWPGGTGPTNDDTPDELAAGFVYVGPIGDHGWTKAHDSGREFLAAELGIETTYEPTVSPADAVAVMDEMVAGGSNVVFTTSFDFVSATQQSAAIHPDVRYLNCSGNVWGPNLSSYMGRMYQPVYLAGIVAGSMTKTDHVAVLASVPIPELVRHVNAFTLGVREVRPTAEVEVSWIMNFFDVVLEPQHTQAFIDHGADVILGQTDTTIPLEAANGQTVPSPTGDTPVYTIGYDNIDACSHAPDTCLTAVYWNWGPMYVDILDQIGKGTWNPQQIRWDQMRTSAADSAVALADLNPVVPAPVRFDVDEKTSDLARPENVAMPFVGPLRDVDGGTRATVGVSLDDEALNRMCWFVDGVKMWDEGTSSLVPAVVPAGCNGDL